LTQANETHLKVLRTNIAAVRAVVEAVAGTLGPKGLDVLLVDEVGRLTLTNDGVEILRQLDVQHPAAQLVVQVADAQDRAVGDGTTTATVLAGSLLEAALTAIEQGVSINLLLSGMRMGIARAVDALVAQARPPADLEDPLLLAVTRVAARGDEALAHTVWQAARRIGIDRLKSDEVRLAELVVAEVGSSHRTFDGVLVGKKPVFEPPPGWQRSGNVLVLADPLEPEGIDPGALASEGGFSRFLEAQNQLRLQVQHLVAAGVVLVVCEKGIAPLAEEGLADAGILAVQRTLTRDSRRVCRFSGARPARRTLLGRGPEALAPWLGRASVRYDPPSGRLVLESGGGQPLATIVVGALTADVASEQERVAVDACAALQAALKGGVVVGGGIAEFVAAQAVATQVAATEGLTRYGLAAVATALRRPVEQIVTNSGYSSLEKVAALEAAQMKTGNRHLGIDCETGAITDLQEAGVVDPLTVKTHALQAAGEIAERILRIQTVVRRRENPRPEA